MMTTVSTIAVAASLVLVTFACGSDDGEVTCAEGTHLDGRSCVPDDLGLADAGPRVDAATVPEGAKRVFVTRTTYKGALGGLAGADGLCQDAADAAARPGTWKAWLSDSDNDAIDRITGDGPWYDLDDAIVFTNHAALSTSPVTEIEVQENGERLVIGDRVWTATSAGGAGDGSGDSDFCGQWYWDAGGSPTVGFTSATDGGWTDSETVTCGTDARLYCFEI